MNQPQTETATATILSPGERTEVRASNPRTDFTPSEVRASNPATNSTAERIRTDLPPDHPEVLLLLKLLTMQKPAVAVDGWYTFKDLQSAALILFGQVWCERRVRLLARASAGQIGSGQNGYKLVRLMDAGEKEHAANWLDHQADDMHLRAKQIREAWDTIQTNRAAVPA